MFVKCKDIMTLPTLNSLTLVGGINGLDRTVTWVYVAECFDDSRQAIEWLYGGELIFITGIGLKGNEKKLIDFMEKINIKNAAGLIINLGPYFKEIPDSAIITANNLNLPLFSLPWEVMLLDISQDICSTIIMKKLENMSLNNLLENILFSDFKTEDNFIERGLRFDYDITGSNRIGIIDIDNFSLFIEEKNITEESVIISIKNQLQKIIHDIFSSNNIKVLTMQRNDSIIFMLKVQDLTTDWIEKIINKIRIKVSSSMPSLTFTAGIGNSYNSLIDIKESFKEAEKALYIGKCEQKISSTLFYQNLGVYHLLLNINDTKLMDNYFNEILGPLIQYDNLNDSNLINTLECYLISNFNMTTASSKLFIHKNTLRYRIKKIQEILNCDLSNIEDCTKFSLAFKIRKLY